MNKWDKRFIELAEHIAQWSKDPSTKVGAVLVSPNRKDVIFGYNGFPAPIWDNPAHYECKKMKYERVLHAEVNAILNAKKDLTDYTLYVSPLAPCSDCTKIIIQAGITRVVYRMVNGGEKWLEEFEISQALFDAAGVKVVRYE